MKPYKLFIFDWDGTLINSSESLTISMIETAQSFKLPFKSRKEIIATFGLPLDTIIPILYPEADVPSFSKLFYKNYAKNSTKAKPFDKVNETLEYLHNNGYSLAIATNKIRSELKNALKQLNWEHFFCALRCGDDEFVKPNPKVVLTLLEELSLTNKDAVLIGDSSYDMQTACTAKIDAIAVSHGVHDNNKLLSFNPILCVKNFVELHSMVISKFSS